MDINILLLDSSWIEAERRARTGKLCMYFFILPLLHVGIVHVPSAAVRLLVTNWLWSDQRSAWTHHYGSSPAPKTHIAHAQTHAHTQVLLLFTLYFLADWKYLHNLHQFQSNSKMDQSLAKRCKLQPKFVLSSLSSILCSYFLFSFH